MKTLRIHTKTDRNGKAVIEVDTEVKNSEIDLIVMVDKKQDVIKDEEKKQKYDFSEFVGAIKWDIEPLAYQRKLRDEW